MLSWLPLPQSVGLWTDLRANRQWDDGGSPSQLEPSGVGVGDGEGKHQRLDVRTRYRRGLDAQHVATLRVSQVNGFGDTVERDRPRRRIGNRPHAVRTGGKFRTVHLERPGRGESSGAVGAWRPDASPRHE